MTHIIAIANQKGGVGKTTTAVNLTAALARGLAGKPARTLLVDVDSQANATTTFLSPAFTLGEEEHLSAYEVLIRQTPARQAIQHIKLGGNKTAPPAGFDLLPSHIKLALADLELVSVPLRREYRLSDALDPLKPDYDYILIDCPPSLGILTVNALIAAEGVVVTSDPGAYSMVGINLLLRTIADVSGVTGLRTLGVALTRLDHTRETRGIETALKESFGEQMLPGIPNRVILREASSNQADIFGYAGVKNDASGAYIELAKEIVRRVERSN